MIILMPQTNPSIGVHILEDTMEREENSIPSLLYTLVGKQGT